MIRCFKKLAPASEELEENVRGVLALLPEDGWTLVVATVLPTGHVRFAFLRPVAAEGRTAGWRIRVPVADLTERLDLIFESLVELSRRKLARQ